MRRSNIGAAVCGMFLLLIAGAFKVLGHNEPSAIVGALKLDLIHKRSDYL